MLLQNITNKEVLSFIHANRPSEEELNKAFCERDYNKDQPVKRHSDALDRALRKLKKQGKILFNPTLKRWTPITPEE